MSATIAMADAPAASSGKGTARCDAQGCKFICWGEPGCEEYSQCEPLLIVSCSPTTAYNLCVEA